jgi:hypothetical protein
MTSTVSPLSLSAISSLQVPAVLDLGRSFAVSHSKDMGSERYAQRNTVLHVSIVGFVDGLTPSVVKWQRELYID